jgi:anti-sigma regulatory factor (Ser/Thr protein kinase)/biotin operon repressor
MIDDSDSMTLDLLRDGPSSSTQVARRLGVSRQAAHARLNKLVEAGRVVREGAARATRYRLPGVAPWERRFPLDGLAEDRVFRRMAGEVEAIGQLTGDASELVAYVVTELVNNAIDHSSGRHVKVSAVERGSLLELEIEDDGVGVFAHVRERLDLESELAAIQELSKGKTTTAPEQHTGEGLFFTSKAVDLFRLESGGLAWIVDDRRGDMAVETVQPSRRGTLAVVEIDLAKVRPLAALFEEYTHDYEFAKTRTVIRLFAIGVRFVSRSEAKRLLRGLERFREVVLDFRGVEGVGQGFADEVFRVWAAAHPDVSLVPVNMNEAVEFMLERARRRRRAK